ncbi:hypothetical protein PPAR_a0922 [Pseudoalteromonas paragorgicola KMM 3548]|nr:hypothetical protein [Pseudoalteromonas distincta KMM 3548]
MASEVLLFLNIGKGFFVNKLFKILQHSLVYSTFITLIYVNEC